MIEQNSAETAKKWIFQAIHDKEMAQAVLAVEAYDTAAFPAHQSVEKLLKGLLILYGKQVPRHHHLDVLAEQLGVLDEIRTEIGELLPDYQISRYPDVSDVIPYLLYTKNISQEKVSRASVIFEQLRARYVELV